MFVELSLKSRNQFNNPHRKKWNDEPMNLVAVMFKYASDLEVGPRAGWPPHQSEAESLEIIRTIFHNDSSWAIELKEAGV